jgi:hypothetical protein
MSDNSLTNPTPQFGTAEYPTKPGEQVCKSCRQQITGSYYRINGMLACAGCKEKVERGRPKDSHSAFVRGMLFGVGGAMIGLILYSTFAIVTGLVIGFVSLAVGYIVGKAILMGSKGIGGRRYQIAAVLLTYLAVSMAAIPIGISQAIKEGRLNKPAHSQQSSTDSSSSAANTSAPTAEDSSAKPRMSLGGVLLTLAFLGIASPFLELGSGAQGLIGLVILFVGVQIAWKLTAGPRMEILGPFPVAAASMGQPGTI